MSNSFLLNTELELSSALPEGFALQRLVDVKKFGDDCPRLCLLPAETGPVYVDFVAGKKNHRRQFGGGKGQPLAKAIAIQDKPSVLDATAGMGGDAFVFASLGCEVMMVERSPVVATLLADALQRGQTVEVAPEVRSIVAKLSLVNADASEFLQQHAPEVDVIYMDPMYPEKKKSAAVKKEMRALQAIVGADMDSEVLLAAALKVAKKRVVVKRPKGAPTLEGIEPNLQISSPNTRYDVYVIKALKQN